MQEWLAAQAADGFKAFAGTEITGSIHVSDTLVTEVVAQAIADAASPTRPASGMAPDLLPALARLIARAGVRATDGTVIVDVEIRV